MAGRSGGQPCLLDAHLSLPAKATRMRSLELLTILTRLSTACQPAAADLPDRSCIPFSNECSSRIFLGRRQEKGCIESSFAGSDLKDVR